MVPVVNTRNTDPLPREYHSQGYSLLQLDKAVIQAWLARLIRFTEDME